ncbi:EboA domain-containing protein [Chitinophaga qingshengii]|uniref:EboA domain-containing protein n=1 Tax=Chitinophaga qingshengii TaxID=1569794 RepID=A0ABR7TLZ2_9BACT|nr:EboA domain-containing protein [Chitinophaga qingshengii]MBC9930993.1 EboA domain-containing protein [Chitinophaga qingshengii]
MSEALAAIIAGNSSEQTREWLQQRLEKVASIPQFNQTFTAIPRFTGKNEITVSPEQAAVLQQLVPGFFVQGWTLDRLIRVWWLLQLDSANKTVYLDTIEKLFLSAEMNELAALYSALPVLAFPDAWKLRTAEGVRSNIGVVQEAIMLKNPYPARYLDEPAWNQLVMKAIFTEKPLHLISGLDERSNAALAAILTDFAHERWAAGRRVSPMQWRLLTAFVTTDNMADLTRVWHSADQVEKAAAALVFAGTSFAPAKTLLATDPALTNDIQNGTLTWDTIAAKLSQ